MADLLERLKAALAAGEGRMIADLGLTIAALRLTGSPPIRNRTADD